MRFRFQKKKIKLKLYANGIGCAVDFQQAAHWYKKASESEHPLAAYALGSLYLEGKGVEKNLEQALHWMTKAEEYGNEMAKSAKDQIKSILLFHELKRKKAQLDPKQKYSKVLNDILDMSEGKGIRNEKDIPMYQYLASQIYMNGISGDEVVGAKLERDPTKMRNLLRKSAEANFGPAIFSLSHVALEGGSFKVALEGFQKCQNLAPSKMILGTMFLHPPIENILDEAKAIEMMTAAAKEGLPSAQKTLGDERNSKRVDRGSQILVLDGCNQQERYLRALDRLRKLEQTQQR